MVLLCCSQCRWLKHNTLNQVLQKISKETFFTKVRDLRFAIVTIPFDTATRETIFFFQMQLSEQIWSNLKKKLLGTQFTHRWDKVLALLQVNIRDKTTTFLFGYVFQSLIHTIWQKETARDTMSLQKNRRLSSPSLIELLLIGSIIFAERDVGSTTRPLQYVRCGSR